MRVLSAPWKKLTGLAGFGLEVVEYIETHGNTEEGP
jgi:GTP cyclohydrolase II